MPVVSVIGAVHHRILSQKYDIRSSLCCSTPHIWAASRREHDTKNTHMDSSPNRLRRARKQVDYTDSIPVDDYNGTFAGSAPAKNKEKRIRLSQSKCTFIRIQKGLL